MVSPLPLSSPIRALSFRGARVRLLILEKSRIWFTLQNVSKAKTLDGSVTASRVEQGPAGHTDGGHHFHLKSREVAFHQKLRSCHDSMKWRAQLVADCRYERSFGSVGSQGLKPCKLR